MQKKSTLLELKLLSILMMLGLFLSSFAMNSGHSTADKRIDPSVPAIPSTGWILDQTVENVECYHMLFNCEGRTVVILKFKNKNKSNVTISWKEVFDTQFQKGLTGILGEKQLVLAPGETGQYDCGTPKFKECITRGEQVSPAYYAEIKQFSFIDIAVTSNIKQ
jgi:hypothetical protein